MHAGALDGVPSILRSIVCRWTLAQGGRDSVETTADRLGQGAPRRARPDPPAPGAALGRRLPDRDGLNDAEVTKNSPKNAKAPDLGLLHKARGSGLCRVRGV